MGKTIRRVTFEYCCQMTRTETRCVLLYTKEGNSADSIQKINPPSILIHVEYVQNFA